MAKEETKPENKKYVSMDANQIAQLATENETIFQKLRLGGKDNKDGYFENYKGGVFPSQKEPTCMFSARADFNVTSLIWFLELAKKNNAGHVTLEMKTNAPIRMQFLSTDDLNPDKQEVKTIFYLAPRITDDFEPKDYQPEDKDKLKELEKENKELKEKLERTKEKMRNLLSE